MLYHLERPAAALAEARRVLRQGGLVAAAAPSRHDSPELAFALPDRPLTFDAERAPELLSRYFADVEVQAWDAPLLTRLLAARAPDGRRVELRITVEPRRGPDQRVTRRIRLRR